MHIKAFRVQNFRRLKRARVDLDEDRTIFVGANNSGKTSATHLFRLFLAPQGHRAFQIYDFTMDCWAQFEAFDPAVDGPAELPRITFDLWLTVGLDDVHRVLDLLPGLDWDGEPLGMRMEYAPRDEAALVTNYEAARNAAGGHGDQPVDGYVPWPVSMLDYLKRTLTDEYEICYSVLDAKSCDDELVPEADYEPEAFAGSGAKAMQAIVRVDFLDAQRHLSDAESRGRGENLSHRLNQFYERNLDKPGVDLAAESAIADAEARLDQHLAEVFESVLAELGSLGYPGVGDPGLAVRSMLDKRGLLASGASVHYRLPGAGDDSLMLPDRYNGLGFKNLIYMVIEVLDFHRAWIDMADARPPIHLVVVEEPETHLHAPPQQVFVRKIRGALGEPEAGFDTQLVVTTHSPHIIYDSGFSPIRYFCRAPDEHGSHLSDVKDLSRFMPAGGDESLTFLRQYLKLSHCDLFFADAAILVEGNVERLLLPIIIERCVHVLTSNHLAILEVGGAFAHRFAELVDFLAVPTLVITDLDSVKAPAAGGHPAVCMVDEAGATTSNQTLRTWLPGLDAVTDLLAAAPEAKAPAHVDGGPGLVRVAYQTPRPATWAEEMGVRTGRTLEEAFALENLEWTQTGEGAAVGLAIADAGTLTLQEIHEKLHERVKTFNKTSFALGILATGSDQWTAPHYIVEGLSWLAATLNPAAPEPAPLAEAVAEGDQ